MAVLRALVFLSVAVATPFILFLLITAETWQGHVMGYSVLAFSAGAVLVVVRRRVGRVLLAASAAGLILLTAVSFAPSDGGAIQSTPISWGTAQLVPEIDQIKLGIALASVVDPHLDSAKGARLANVALPIYREMRRQPGLQRLRSALGYGYSELFGMQQSTHHMFYSVPKTKRPPVLIFLHGAAGNFQSYTYLLSKLEMIVVSPTQGFGAYRDPKQEAQAFQAARDFAVNDLGGDPHRIFLAALSQGGTAACRIGRRADVSGVILISPVLDNDALRQWGEVPVLMIHGAQDVRVSMDFVERGLNLLRSRSATVALRRFEEEDHFLLYSSSEAVLEDIRDWVQNRNAPTERGADEQNTIIFQ